MRIERPSPHKLSLALLVQLQVAPRSGVVYFLQMPEHLTKGHQIERQRGRVVGVALLNMPPNAIHLYVRTGIRFA